MSGKTRNRCNRAPAKTGKVSQTRAINHLQDHIYREMFRLELNRPGAEMGLALALLQAVVQSAVLRKQDGFAQWLASVCPIGLQMIEASLASGCCRSKSNPKLAPRSIKVAPLSS